jgi:hypothetical protein
VSFVELDGTAWVLRPQGLSWSTDDVTVDDWLADRDAPPLAERVPVLAYGSNACPGKLVWLRAAMGLSGPAVVLEADIEGAAAVWSAGNRIRDGQRPAVLVRAPGITERHAVWLATPDQLGVLDLVEGRGQRHRLAWVHLPVTLANRQRLERVLAYLALPAAPDLPPALNRAPLLVNGSFVRMRDLDQQQARRLQGIPAETDGLPTSPFRGP